MEKASKFVIIGAGPAGISAALGLQEDYRVLEASSDIGGLSASLEIDGAVFDLGGHSFHTPHPEVRELVYSKLEMFEQKRDARCFSYGDIIPYPFQKNFTQLQRKDVVDECELGLKDLNSVEPQNYEEFINSRFGNGISKHFMLPYNRKLWGRDLSKLAFSWTAERVAAPSGKDKKDDDKFDTKGGKRTPLQANTKVAYPAKGGFSKIFKALSQDVQNVETGQKVKAIDWEAKKIWTESGETYSYEKLISTLALPELFKRLHKSDESMLPHLQSLDCLALKLVLVVIDHPVDTEIQRIYSAESEVAAHKTAINHNSSDYLRSLPRHGVMAEVSHSEHKPLARQDIEKWVVENLKTMGVIKNFDEVKTVKVVDAKYAYPVPNLNREQAVEGLKSWLAERDIYSLGRFGEWAYINSDEVIHRGLSLGKKLASA